MYRKILVPIDGSQTSARGLLEAIRLAKECGATIRLINIVEEYSALQSTAVEGGAYNLANLIEILQADGKRIVAQALAKVRKHGVKVDAVSFESFANRCADLIVKEAKKWRANLIVMGTHGRRGVSRMVLGSDAEIVVRTSPVPVLLVRYPERSARARSKKAS
jgi:nucleotide-binding universal stress UspA family protein